MERKDYLQNARASGGVVTLTPNIFPSKRLNINSQLQLPVPFIVLGDFNGHNTLWGSVDTNARGRQVEKLLDKFRRYPTTANHIAFKRAKSFFRKIRRQSKNGSFQKYVGSIQGHLSSKRMWEKVRKILGTNKFYHGISFLQNNGQLVSHTKGIANTLGSAFANVSSGDSYSQTFIHYKKQQEKRRIDFNTLTSLAYNVDFSLHELRRAIRSSHPTTPGPDGIHYDMLKNLSTKSFCLLLILFNRIWNEHVFPMACNRAIVIPILKPGKNPEDSSSYRPIALTSCLCKTLERMINARLIHVLEEKKLLTEFQSGFRYGRSTMDNILNLETAIRDAFITKKHVVSIFFDIEKAYDRAWRHGILNDLHNMGFRGNLPIFIQNFLLKRTFNVRINDILSDNFIQNEGVPQGSILSVILFIIKINGIIHNLPPYVHGSLF
ncbi:putative RNA-directed DNA polymerase from transposon BS, partial [Araneus ventricosus]